MTNCRLTDPEFERGIRNFLAVCNVVDVFRHTRILQIAPRPFDFWSTMCNEGELLEKFNIQLSPIPMPELTAEMKKVKEEGLEVEKVVAYCMDKMCVKIKPEELVNVAALKVAMKNLADKYGCNAIAIQCWNALQGEIGIMPCAANSLLNEEGIPVVCETDIHGAITAVLVEAAGMDENRSFLQTGPFGIRIMKMGNCFSIAGHGRFPWQGKSRLSDTLLHLIIPVLWKHRLNQAI